MPKSNLQVGVFSHSITAKVVGPLRDLIDAGKRLKSNLEVKIEGVSRRQSIMRLVRFGLGR